MKKYRKRLFWPRKWPNHGSQLGKKCRFCVYSRSTSSIFGSMVLKKKIKSFPPIAKHIWQRKKHENFPKNLEKGQNYTTFSTPKMNKTRMSILQKVPIFGCIFALRALFLALLYWKKKSFPLIAKHIWKKKKKIYIFFPTTSKDANIRLFRPQIVKTRIPILQKVTIFTLFLLYELFFVLKKKINRSP